MTNKTSVSFYAFISYKREDEKWARWLQRKLEGYRLPTAICKKRPELPKRLKPVFRDKTDIQPGLLNEELRRKLDQSQYLIVICSPLSAQSTWVGNEVDYFIQQGRQDKIILFVVAGMPYSGDKETECIHPILKEKLPEMLCVNIHEQGVGNRFIKRQRACIMVLSKMLNVAFDSLWQRQRRRIRRNIILCAALVLCFCISVGFAWKHNQPFNMTIQLSEKAPINKRLSFPVDGGVLYVTYGGRTDSLIVDGLNKSYYLREVPAKYLGSDITAKLKLYGFNIVDTVMPLQKTIALALRRNDAYGNLHGYVANADDRRLPHATVQVLSYTTQTDADGNFKLAIPFADQQEEYSLTATYQGTAITEMVYPISEILITIK